MPAQSICWSDNNAHACLPPTDRLSTEFLDVIFSKISSGTGESVGGTVVVVGAVVVVVGATVVVVVVGATVVVVVVVVVVTVDSGVEEGVVDVVIGVVVIGSAMLSSGSGSMILWGVCECVEVDIIPVGGIRGNGGIVDLLNASLPQQCIWPDVCRPQVCITNGCSRR